MWKCFTITYYTTGNTLSFFVFLSASLSWCYFVVLSVSLCHSSRLILDFRGSASNVQKGNPIVVTKFGLILQNWWELKVLARIVVNKLPSCTHLLWYTAFLQFLISFQRLLRIFGNGRRRKFRLFLFCFFLEKVTVILPPTVKSTERILKKILYRTARQGCAVKILIPRTSKMPVSSFWDVIMLKN